MDSIAWIQLGGIALTATGLLSAAAWAVVKAITKKIDKSDERVDTRFDKVDFQFSKVDLKFEEKFGQVTQQIDRLKETGNDRHIANIERLARLEGQISALPQKIDQNGLHKAKPTGG